MSNLLIDLRDFLYDFLYRPLKYVTIESNNRAKDLAKLVGGYYSIDAIYNPIHEYMHAEAMDMIGVGHEKIQLNSNLHPHYKLLERYFPGTFEVSDMGLFKSGYICPTGEYIKNVTFPEYAIDYSLYAFAPHILTPIGMYLTFKGLKENDMFKVGLGWPMAMGPAYKDIFYIGANYARMIGLHFFNVPKDNALLDVLSGVGGFLGSMILYRISKSIVERASPGLTALEEDLYE